MTGRVWQCVPVLEPGDAVGNHALRLAGALGERHAGFIVERAARGLQDVSTVFTEARTDPGDVLLYHVALSSQLVEWMRRVRGIKAIDYHNVTPPSFFRAYDPDLATALMNVRFELRALKDEVELAIAHSEYSRADLVEAGFRRTETVPVLVDFPPLEGAEAREGRGDVLFVGRLAPNKRQEDVVKAFTVYRRVFNPRARLCLVGGSNAGGYEQALRSFVARLGIEEVHFAGRVGPARLASHYRTADVFLSMSVHEGFGAPFLEAMHAGVPVVARAAAAVPETVGEGGVLVREGGYEEVAALVDLVVRDEGIRAQLVAAGRRRAEEFRPEVHAGRYRALLEELA